MRCIVATTALECGSPTKKLALTELMYFVPHPSGKCSNFEPRTSSSRFPFDAVSLGKVLPHRDDSMIIVLVNSLLRCTAWCKKKLISVVPSGGQRTVPSRLSQWTVYLSWHKQEEIVLPKLVHFSFRSTLKIYSLVFAQGGCKFHRTKLWVLLYQHVLIPPRRNQNSQSSSVSNVISKSSATYVIQFFQKFFLLSLSNSSNVSECLKTKLIHFNP